jgi:transcriptional regulator with XRE-family HTH domain
MGITSEQIRAARALLRWEQKDLAEASKVSLPSVKRLETIPGDLAAQERTVDALRQAIEASGVEFTNGERPGVRWRGWKWYTATLGPDGVQRKQRMHPDFESTFAAAKMLKSKLVPPDKPFVHVPAEATGAERAALIDLGLSAVWP